MSQGNATVTPVYGSAPGAGSLGDALAFGGNVKFLPGSFSFDTNYTAGGEAFNVGGYFKEIVGVLFPKVGGYSFEYIPSSGLVKAYVAGGTEASGNLSAMVIPFLAVGI